jgi:hypothetical protein
MKKALMLLVTAVFFGFIFVIGMYGLTIYVNPDLVVEKVSDIVIVCPPKTDSTTCTPKNDTRDYYSVVMRKANSESSKMTFKVDYYVTPENATYQKVNFSPIPPEQQEYITFDPETSTYTFDSPKNEQLNVILSSQDGTGVSCELRIFYL